MSARVFDALILRRVEYRDADLILSLYTREAGKLRVIAPNARSSRRRFVGGLDPMQRATMMIRVRETASLQRLEQSSLTEAFLSLREKLPRLEAAGALVTLLDRHLEEGSADEVLFDRAIRALEEMMSRDGARDIGLERDAFRLFFLERMGQAPVLDRCVESSLEAPLDRPAFFDPRRGGVVSRRYGGGPYLLSPAARFFMSEALSSPSAPALELSEDECEAIKRSIDAFFEAHFS